MKKIFYLFILVVFAAKLDAQVYKKYIHYNTENGLPTNELYNGIESKDGFIFMTSNVGLIRYDGYEFKIFDAKDGLTDADIIYCNEDSLGRIWVGPINSDLYFYYKGIIYNRFNNKLVKKIYDLMKDDGFFNLVKFKSNLVFYKHSLNKIINITNNKIKIISFFKQKKEKIKGLTYCVNFGDSLLISNYNSTIKYYSNKNKPRQISNFLMNLKPYYNYNNYYIGSSNITRKIYKLNLSKLLIENEVSFFDLNIDYDIYDIFIKDNKIYFAAGNIIYTTDLDFKNQRKISQLPPKTLISGIIIDKNNNLWAVTRNEGLYFFENYTNNNTSNIPFFENASISKFSIPDSNKLYTFYENITYEIDIKTNQYIKKKLQSKEKKFITLKNIYPFNNFLYYHFSNDIIAIYNIKTKKQILIPQKITQRMGSIKSLAIKNKDSIFLSSSNGVYLIDKSKIYQLYPKRSTCICYNKYTDKLYFGTINNVYEYDLKTNKLIDLGLKEKKLNQRIIFLKNDSYNNLWIATGTGSIFYINEGKIIYSLDMKNGLIGNLITNIQINKKQEVCFATNKGVTVLKYNFQNDIFYNQAINSYTKEDGLKETYINDAYLLDSLLYTSSNSGIDIVNLNKTTIDTNQLLQIIEFKVNDKIIPYNSSFKFKHNQNYLKIKYSTFNFSNSNSYYKYRLLPIQKNWITTSDRSKEFGPLEPQKYTFEIQAINKNGISISKIKTLKFEIVPAFWQTIWFKLLIILLTSILLFLILFNYNSKKHQELNFSNQLSDLKIKALRAQMNPHFIFNCLNTIQSYINQGDNLESNRFIAKFSTLIRQTLNLSDETYINIADEVNYLNNYIELEWLRFNQNFEYNIHIEGINKPEKIFIPSMLIQPLVENSIRHGLRNIKSGGKININISKINTSGIKILVEDNGIGINKLNINDKEKSSKGIKIIKDRIKTYSEIIKKEITIEFIDLNYNNQNKVGTLVKVFIPF